MDSIALPVMGAGTGVNGPPDSHPPQSLRREAHMLILTVTLLPTIGAVSPLSPQP